MKLLKIVILIFITLLFISCSNNRIASKNCENDGISFELTRIEDTTSPQDGFDVTLTITNNSNKDYLFYNLWYYFAEVYHEDKPAPRRGRPQWINFNNPQYTLVKSKNKIVIQDNLNTFVSHFSMLENAEYELEISYEFEDNKLFKRVYEGPIKSNRIKFETGSITGERNIKTEFK